MARSEWMGRHAEVPHFRYTDGTTYLKEAPSPERTGNLSRWSVTSPPQPQGFEISEEEGHFTVSYLAKQLERSAGTWDVYS
ncbi:hypothetical protein OS493_011161 [Desmophyllum pertusum]|uniref:Uncharacterized protein n=1 Tax=Desmophyllum pertusum TaxID=174260 RepID=A0A9X0CTF2_9CNID|nr:hypothetical protein OS493_011161 [Desmophyllum pertusum]